MSPRDDPDSDEQKHEQKKRNPLRLFSFDSIKSNNSSRRSSSDQETTRNFRSTLIPNVQESDNETNFFGGDHPGQATFVEEPTSDTNPAITSSSHTGRGRSSTRPERTTPTSTSSRSSTSTPDNAPPLPLTTPRARWENVRQYVLPGRVRPSSPLQKQTPSQASLPRPSASSSTPKPSGRSRLGFKQAVVELTQNIDDDTRKFGKEILKACAAVRYAEVSRLTRDRDGQLSSTSLSGTTTSALTGRKSDYFPQSIASLTSGSGSATAPSLKPLYQVLIYHSQARSSPETGQTPLPHESHVLGTLLCPFLTPSKYPIVKEEEEKATAVEAFERILKFWAPIDEVSCYPNIVKIVLTDMFKSARVDRCLWCTKAAATIGPSAIRSRILSSLWLLFVRGDEYKISLSTHGFKSVAAGLLTLLATFSLGFSSSSDTQTLHHDIQLLKDLILQFLSGSFGDLDETHLEEVYGVEYGMDDRKHAGALRRGVFLEGLVGCIENCLGTRTGVWLLENLLEVISFAFFALLSLNLIIPIGVLVSAIHRQVDATSSNHLQSETEHLLPRFFDASATFFSVVFNYVPILITHVLPFLVLSSLVLSSHVLSFHVLCFCVFIALLTIFYPNATFCHRPKAAASHSSITAKTCHSRSGGFRFDEK